MGIQVGFNDDATSSAFLALPPIQLAVSFLVLSPLALMDLCVPKTCATWVDASTGCRPRSAVSGTLLAMLA
jgi:hypothetical protein